jgi:hypothetical protein
VKTCPDCNGDGVIEKGTDDERQCLTCGGSGFVPDDDDDEEVIRTVSGMPTCLRGMRAVSPENPIRPDSRGEAESAHHRV